MSRLRTCKLCGLPIQKEDPCIPLGNRYTHERCFNNWSQELANKKQAEVKEKTKAKRSRSTPKTELKAGVSEEEYKEKQQYYNYFKKLLGGDLSPKVYKLSQDYIREYGVRFHDLYNTLVYLNEIINYDLKGDIVGIIPFYLSKAKQYFIELQQIEENTKEIDLQNMYQTKTVQIKPHQKSYKLIDIESV